MNFSFSSVSIRIRTRSRLRRSSSPDSFRYLKCVSIAASSSSMPSAFDADRFDDDDVEAGRVEKIDNVVRRFCEAAEKSAGCHRADEDAAVRVEIRHANAVAEDCAAGEWRGGVDGDDADALFLFAVELR